MKRVPTRDIIWLFVLTRLMLVLMTYTGYILLTAPKYSMTSIDIAGLFTSWNHWDAANYVRIAHDGYLPTKPFDVAFFPLFPLLISLIAHMLGDWSYLTVGMVLSNLFLLGSLFVMYQIAADIGGDEVARRSLLYICIFPTAFYFFAAYNESLFLLLSSASILAMRRQRWWLSGILGLLAALTRSAGILLIIPYLIELWEARTHFLLTTKNLLLRLLPILLIPFGTALYSLYCWLTTGDPLAFAMVQTHWQRHTAVPGVGIVQALFDLFWTLPFASFYSVHTFLDLAATLGFIVLAILGRHRLRLSYTIWVCTLLIYILLSPGLPAHDPLSSNQRFVLEMFPAFITLAMLGIKYPRLDQAIKLIFPVLLATLGLLFVMNRWMV